MLDSLLAATTRRRHQGRQGDRPRARRRSRRTRCRHRHRQHLRLDDPVGRPPARAARRAAGHPVARLRPHRGGRLLRPARLDPRVRPGLGDRADVLGANALISVKPGLMIWTIVCFLVVAFVLKRYAFGPIQKMIDDAPRADPAGDRGGRQRPRRGRDCSRSTALIGQAVGGRGDPRRGPPDRRRPARAGPRGDRGRPPAPARGDPPRDRAGDAPGARADPRGGRRAQPRSRPRRSPARRSTGDDQHRLIDEALAEIDFSRLEGAGRSGRPPHLRAALFEAAESRGRSRPCAARLQQYARRRCKD